MNDMPHASPGPRTVSVCLLGPGRVGRAFLQQVIAGRGRLAARSALRLALVAVADADGIAAATGDEIDDATLRSLIAHKAAGLPLRSWRPTRGADSADLVAGLDPRSAGAVNAPAVLVDASAADTTASILDALGAGWRVALANKIPLTGDYQVFDRIARDVTCARWETTVASALPIVGALRRLLDQGDDVRWITGTLSGTLGHVTRRLETGGSASTAVADAIARGVSEPDPRSDLSGADIARKALILARMTGLALELTDVAVEPLYPPAWDGLDLREFLDRLGELDAPLARRFAAARDQATSLRYAATIGGGEARVGWIVLDENSPLACVDPGDSAVVIESDRFDTYPLVVSGRGGGPEMTAAGLWADVIELAR